MKENFKAAGHIAKRVAILIAIQIAMFFFAFFAFKNFAVNFIFGLLIIAAECVLFFIAGMGQARLDFGKIRINKSRYPNGDAPLSQKILEPSLLKAAAISVIFVMFFTIFITVGAAVQKEAVRKAFQTMVKFGFSGVTLICSALGLNNAPEVIKDPDTLDVSVLPGANIFYDKGGVFFAVFFVGAVIIAAAYFIGFFWSRRQRLRQQAELLDEIKEIDDLAKQGKQSDKFKVNKK